MITKLPTITTVVLGLIFVLHDSAAAKPYCCVKRAYCCIIKRDCCPNAAVVDLSRLVAQASKTAPTCCAKHAYCCSLRNRCCPNATNAGDRPLAMLKSPSYDVAPGTCCAQRADCCKIQRPCCGSNAKVQVT